MVERFGYPLVAMVICVSTLAGDQARTSEELIGSWQVSEFVYAGKSVSREHLEGGRATIGKDRITIQLPKVDKGTIELTYKLVPEGINLLDGKDQPEFDPLLGVFERKGDTLRLAFHNVPQDGKRPQTPEAGKDLTYIVFVKANAK